MTQEEFNAILENHKKWLEENGGERANLKGANLCDANLCDADLCGADLRGADLRGANLRGVRYNEQTAYYAMQCPEKGAYIGYKKAEGKIVELEIQADAKRSSATTRKCRASKA